MFRGGSSPSAAPGHLDITSPRAVIDAPRPGSWLRTHNGHPLRPLRGGPAGPSLLVVVQADNGPHLRFHPSVEGGVTRPPTDGLQLKPAHRCLIPLPGSCQQGDRCKGAGLTAQVQAHLIKSESCPGHDLRWEERAHVLLPVRRRAHRCGASPEYIYSTFTRFRPSIRANKTRLLMLNAALTGQFFGCWSEHVAQLQICKSVFSVCTFNRTLMRPDPGRSRPEGGVGAYRGGE